MMSGHDTLSGVLRKACGFAPYEETHMLRFAVALVGTCLLCLAGVTAVCAEDSIDWNSWRALPVQSGGRQKPLDSLARETLRTITASGSLADPTTNERLDPAAAYLSMVLDWRGWEHPEREKLELVADWHPLYFHLHEPDHWDRMPLLRVESPDLRSDLGLDKNSNCISPYKLANTTIEERRTERKIPFPTWAKNLLTIELAGEELTELEQQGVELANRLWLYQDHRMGRGLEVVPIPGSEVRKWMPVAQLHLTRFDDGV